MPDGVSAPGAAGQQPVAAPAAPTETILVAERVVACDGGGVPADKSAGCPGDGPLGHPRVYLRIVHDAVVCPYCSRLYVLTQGEGHGDGH